jgi:hypothetical protein
VPGCEKYDAFPAGFSRQGQFAVRTKTVSSPGLADTLARIVRLVRVACRKRCAEDLDKIPGSGQLQSLRPVHVQSI